MTDAGPASMNWTGKFARAALRVPLAALRRNPVFPRGAEKPRPIKAEAAVNKTKKLFNDPLDKSPSFDSNQKRFGEMRHILPMKMLGNPNGGEPWRAPRSRARL